MPTITPSPNDLALLGIDVPVAPLGACFATEQGARQRYRQHVALTKDPQARWRGFSAKARRLVTVALRK